MTYKENLINTMKLELTPEKVTKLIERRKRHLIEIVKLVGKEDAIQCIESTKDLVFPSGLSSFEISQIYTDNFDQIAFIKSLPDSEYAA